MIKRLFLFVCVVFVFSLSPAHVGCTETPEDKPRVFTNEDVKRYRGPSGVETTDPKPALQEDRESDLKDKAKRISEKHEMEYWCKKAGSIKRRIEDDKEAIKEIKDQDVEPRTKSSSSRKKTKSLEKRLEKAKKRLRNSESDLKDLEDEAHRKGVPPGWLRCQL